MSQKWDKMINKLTSSMIMAVSLRVERGARNPGSWGLKNNGNYNICNLTTERCTHLQQQEHMELNYFEVKLF